MTNEITKPTEIIIRKLSKPGCRPCAVLGYMLESIADQLAKANAVVSEHDIVLEHDLIRRYEITSVPVLVFERNGVEITRLNGMVSAEEVMDAVDYAKESR